jgi:DNA-directed RNA polymerase subunit RPC12/RpoP
MTKLINRDELLSLATSSHKEACPDCQSLTCDGWESIPGGFETKALECIGTLRVEDSQECWEEYHPDGTDLWSKNAPIAIGFHPYNKSDVYQCKKCGSKYLRYLEAGGYYVDERIRKLDAKLII